MSLRSEPEFGQLSKLAEKLRLSESSFQSLIYRLGPQQRRLFLLLAEEGVASTMEVRTRCSIGNPSDVANQLNAKLADALDCRVVCELRPHANQYGDRGRVGWWRLVNVGRPAANDDTASDTATA